MLEQLRNFNLDRIDLDEMVALFAFGENLKVVYGNLLLEVPEWVTDNVATLQKEIHSRRRDSLEKELKKAQASLESLKTADEKRQDIRAKIERLQTALG